MECKKREQVGERVRMVQGAILRTLVKGGLVTWYHLCKDSNVSNEDIWGKNI